MSAEFDFIVVGAGAGGGPLACRLARDPKRYRVALIDAGSNPAVTADGGENYNYAVPALHARASEDAELSFDYFVRHYSDDARQSRDSKIYPPRPGDPHYPVHDEDPRHNGVWYPRAGTLGGCTAHNAMITVYPHNEDWESIRQITGDDSWKAERMRQYFEKLEDCRYAPMQPNNGRHGFGNWLSTSLLDFKVLQDALGESSIRAIAVAAVKTWVEDILFEMKGLPTPSQIQAFFDRARVFLETMSSVAGDLPEAKQGLLQKLHAAVSGDQAVSHLKALLPLLLPDILRFRKKSTAGAQGTAAPGPTDLLIDKFLQGVLGGASIDDIVDLLVRYIDPNDWRIVSAGLEGLFAIPLATDGVKRSSPRDFIEATQVNCPYRLEVMTNTLVTRIVFEGTRAVGVRCVTRPNAYFASPLNTDRLSASPAPLSGEQELRVRHEVILAGGAFNTPQLLMLSGVGPETELNKWRVAPVGKRFWPGVGQNLQDRYELAVISEMTKDFEILKSCSFETPRAGSDDPCFRDWRDQRTGLYTTNGGLFSFIKRSSVAEHLVPQSPGATTPPPPDLYIFGLLGFFKGYFPKYSAEIEKRHNILTWAILKGHTRNNAGEVTLRSLDPRDPPLINFKNFDDGNVQPGSAADKDIQALIEGIAFVKRMLDRTGQAVKVTAWPDVPLDNLDDPVHRNALANFILNETWGHHACGTCKIGKDPNGTEQAVVDSQFRLHGLQGLRIVDASIFPRIPGFFIVTPIYMISEKAADVILDAAQ